MNLIFFLQVLDDIEYDTYLSYNFIITNIVTYILGVQIEETTLLFFLSSICWAYFEIKGTYDLVLYRDQFTILAECKN